MFCFFKYYFTMGRKRQRQESTKSEDSSSDSDAEPVAIRRSEAEESEPKKSKWTNKQRVLVFGCRGLSFRDRHLVFQFFLNFINVITATTIFTIIY